MTKKDVEILSIEEILSYLKISRTGFYKIRKQGKFPDPFYLFENQKGPRWYKDDVEQYLLNKKNKYLQV